jgi:hypothetical protein
VADNTRKTKKDAMLFFSRKHQVQIIYICSNDILCSQQKFFSPEYKVIEMKRSKILTIRVKYMALSSPPSKDASDVYMTVHESVPLTADLWRKKSLYL